MNLSPRRVGIIGVGHVGAHCAFSLAAQGIVDELVLVDTNRQKAISECQDLRSLICLTVCGSQSGSQRISPTATLL